MNLIKYRPISIPAQNTAIEKKPIVTNPSSVRVGGKNMLNSIAKIPPTKNVIIVDIMEYLIFVLQ